jgi:hypothetical protein
VMVSSVEEPWAFCSRFDIAPEQAAPGSHYCGMAPGGGQDHEAPANQAIRGSQVTPRPWRSMAGIRMLLVCTWSGPMVIETTAALSFIRWRRGRASPLN